MAPQQSPPPQYDRPPSPAGPSTPSQTLYSSAPASYPQPVLTSRPSFKSRPSLMDELIPLPSQTPKSTSARSSLASAPFVRILRRIGSLAVISIFLLSISFMASTSTGHHSRTGLRTVFGIGSDAGIGGAEWVAQDLGEVSGNGGGMDEGDANGQVDFEKYVKMRTISPPELEGRRLIMVGDIHGSFDPLQRLLSRLNFDMENDRLIHVGDLVAKGIKDLEVLEWMDEFNIQGVRGNHDQPVVQWRSWMEWAGGDDWEAYVDSLSAGGPAGVVKALSSEGKMYPKGWEWKGEHWKIARNMKKKHYDYLLNLPLALHLPSLHAFIVHAGLLPYDITKSHLESSQPLVAASKSTFSNVNAGRMTEELSVLLDVPQNTDPYTLINMRSVYTKGKKQGEVTKSAKKGKPWADIWKKEMKRCRGAGYVQADGDDEDDKDEDHGSDGLKDIEDWEMDEVGEGQGERKRDDDDKVDDDEEGAALKCSPITVIYGHAAGRGLDIKRYSKGIDTGCVYGRQLTALVIGDTKGVQGQTTHVGDTKATIVSIKCGEGGQ